MKFSETARFDSHLLESQNCSLFLTVFSSFLPQKMVELSDPKGPVQEGIDNSIFIIPGIIVISLICESIWHFLFLEPGTIATGAI